MNQVLILLLVFLGIFAGGSFVRIHARRQRAAAVEMVQLDPDTSGQPRILSFYGPSCDACDRQKQVLAGMQRAQPGAFSLELRDATVDYDYARQFGLLIVPTTIVVSATGAISAINSGFTPLTTLEAQLAAA